MLNIDKDSTLEVLLAGAITTNQIPFVVSYNNRLNTTYLNGEIYSKKISGTNAVVMLPVITSDTAFRIIEDINITNSDTVSADVTIRTKNNNQYYNLITVSLDSGDTLQYSSGNGWSVITSTGQIKTGYSGGGMVYPSVGIALSTGSSWGASITDNSTNWNTAYSWGNHALAGYATATSITSFTNKTGNISQWTNDSGYLTSINSTQITTALGYTPVTNARTLTINGTTYDLSANRSWTISAGTTYTFSTGLNDNAGTVTSNLSTGVSGGQSVIGGTASGNNLTLSSTSNATKGKIIFGTSAYDEVNNRLGIGTTSPVARLDVSSPSGGAGTGIRLIQATNNVSQPFSYTSIDFTVPTTGLIGQFFATASNYSNPSVNLAANSVGLISWDTNAQLLLGAAGSNGYISFDTGGYGYSNERMRIIANGNVGIGQTSPTAVLHIKAGTASAGTAPIKLTSGTNLTTAEAGAMEYNNTPHFTNSDATRRHMVLSPSATKTTAGAPYTNDGYITVNIGGTDFKILTTA